MKSAEELRTGAGDWCWVRDDVHAWVPAKQIRTLPDGSHECETQKGARVTLSKVREASTILACSPRHQAWHCSRSQIYFTSHFISYYLCLYLICSFNYTLHSSITFFKNIRNYSLHNLIFKCSRTAETILSTINLQSGTIN